MDKSIKKLLGITDLNIEFDYTQPEQFHEEVIKEQTVTVWHFKLTYHRRCDQCGFTLNNNGTKLVRHVGPRSGFHFNYFEIRKQKYICSKCGHTAIAEFNDVEPGDHIMRKVKQTAAMELSENVSQKHIAMDNNISTHTVMRQADGLFSYNKTNFHYLPKHIAFDDFKSGKFSESGMSMILIDSTMHRVLDVMRNRGDGALAAYFEQYSVEARRGVQTITIDLFTPYRKMIKALFPNAKIIADRFHVVTQAYRALNQIRIQTMKKYGSDSREYRQLKRFWKLLMKKETDLDFTARKKRINFQYSYLTDQEVVERLLQLSDELRDSYNFYQEIIFAVSRSNQDYLDAALFPDKNDAQYQHLAGQMKHARRTLCRHREEILNSFIYGYSNGPVEGANNKIKAIKRVAYGFRSFNNFRLRILISFKNSFYSMNYKAKTAELESSAA